MIEVIGFDGDDTLWHDESFFTSTRQQFVRLLCNYSDEESICTRLFEVEMRNLRSFGYGAKGFILSMIETAIELSNRRVTCADIQDIINLGKELIDHPVHLLDGVRDALLQLQGEYRLVLITKGDLTHQEAKIAGSELGPFFRAVEVVSEKDPLTYKKILAELHVTPDQFVMVGNSVRSDALPVLEIGGAAVIIPYPLIWKYEDVTLQHFPTDRFHRIDHIRHLPPVLERLNSGKEQP